MTINIYQVILAPHVSEKAAVATEKRNQYVFRVAKSANKYAVRQAVQQLFGVTVEGVQLLNVKPKQKRFGRSQGVRSGWKKAYVKVAAGQQIDLTQVQA
jgi:large subunit ribosomal protein L23